MLAVIIPDPPPSLPLATTSPTMFDTLSLARRQQNSALPHFRPFSTSLVKSRLKSQIKKSSYAPLLSCLVNIALSRAKRVKWGWRCGFHCFAQSYCLPLCFFPPSLLSFLRSLFFYREREGNYSYRVCPEFEKLVKNAKILDFIYRSNRGNSVISSWKSRSTREILVK